MAAPAQRRDVAWGDLAHSWGIFLTHSPRGGADAAFITFGLADLGLPDLIAYAPRAAFRDEVMKRGAVSLLTSARNHLVKLKCAPAEGEEILLVTRSNRRIRAAFHREPFTVHDRTGLLAGRPPQRSLYRVEPVPAPPTPGAQRRTR